MTMNQIDTGKFIADCRKEKGLTQARLAEMLNITDRAVSKWETGKCMPDSSIMPALCRILDISVDELLSGKRAETEAHHEKFRRNLTESKRKNTVAENRVIPTVYTAALGIGILVCCLCDIAVSGALGWSLIVLSSVFFAWIVSFPMLLLRKNGIVISLISVSIFTVPFLYILRILLNVREIFRIGKVMSVIALVFLWTVFALYHRLKERKLLSGGNYFFACDPLYRTDQYRIIKNARRACYGYLGYSVRVHSFNTCRRFSHRRLQKQENEAQKYRRNSL